jgi:glycosyltransferase involved in cell wall biosynthesis
MEVNATELGIARMVGSHLVLVCQQAYGHALSLGIPESRVTLIPNGVDVKEFRPNVPAIDLRARFGIPNDSPLVGYVGRFNWEKGPDLFVRMVEIVHRKRKDVHFVMVGDGPMRDELHALAAELGVTGCLHFAGLLMNTPQVYPAFDLLVQTSNIEGMPYALLEGMACGLPSAVINVGGVGELAVAGVTGTLSAQGDYGGVAEAVLMLLENPEQMKQMGLAARQRVERCFNIRDRIAQFAGLFQTLVSQNREPVPTGIWNAQVASSDWWSTDCHRVKVEKAKS